MPSGFQAETAVWLDTDKTSTAGWRQARHGQDKHGRLETGSTRRMLDTEQTSTARRKEARQLSPSVTAGSLAR